MKTKAILLLVTIWSGLLSIAQTPQHVTQGDNEQTNFWESNTAMITGAVVILLLIIARSWSKRIHKKRDEAANKEEEGE